MEWKIVLLILTIVKGFVYGFSMPVLTDHSLEDFTVVSVWSECSHLPTHERSQLHIKAALEKFQFKYLINDSIDLKHFSFDVCENTEMLLQILVNVCLDGNYYFPSDLTFDGGKTVVNKHMNLILLAGYVTEIQSKLIKKIMGFTDIHKFCHPTQCDDRFTIRTTTDNAMALLDTVDHFGWRNIKMISVTDMIAYPYHTLFLESLRIFNETQRFCIHSKVLNITELYPDEPTYTHQFRLKWYIQHVIKFLGTVEDSLLIIFGNRDYVLEIQSLYKRDGVCIVFDQSNMFYTSWSDVTNIISVFEKARKTYTNLGDSNLVFDQAINVIQSLKFMFQVSSSGDIINTQNKLEFLKELKTKSIHRFNNRFVLPFGFPVKLPVGFELSTDRALNYTQAFLHEYQHYYPSLKCRQLDCQPGYEKRYEQQAIENTHSYEKGGWGSSGENELLFGMRCTLCPINHIKTEYGDGPCIACVGVFSIDNGLRTECIDPYTNYDLEMDVLVKPLTYILGVFGTCSTLMVMAVFYFQRGSPTVRSSDYHLSLVHLLSIVITYVVGLFSMFASISNEMCVVRNLNVSFFYCINVACVYTKSEKILNAFMSKVRITLGEMNRTIATQVFSSVVLVLTANSLLCVLYFIKEPRIEFWQDSDKWHRIHYCNTTYHQTYLIAYFTVLQLVCSWQAFRGRNLPGPMNDAISMVYAILFSTATFGVSFPISYFREQGDVESLQLLVVFVNLFCFVVFFYGTKCFVIVFRPEKNTREYFNKRRMEAMQARTGFKPSYN